MDGEGPTCMLKSPPRETLWEPSPSAKKSPAAMVAAPPSSMTWRSRWSRSDASAARSNSEKKGPCRAVLTQCTAQSFPSCTSWYSRPPLLAASILPTSRILEPCRSLRRLGDSPLHHHCVLQIRAEIEGKPNRNQRGKGEEEVARGLKNRRFSRKGRNQPGRFLCFFFQKPVGLNLKF
jgi:hypothetical protein